ncbi:MAG: hypothetical protein JWL61_3978 [Gemmatimonadetes bacterium]|nr:hypothetical protein [Gemmatimonadota bacterium]
MRSLLHVRSIVLPSLSASVLWACLACGGTDSTTPQTPLIPAGTVQAPLVSADIGGGGGVSVTAKAIPDGYFDADIAVHVVNARPSTTYIVQRAPEIGRALGNDGICQRALGLAPWSSADVAAPAFVSFPQTGATAPVMFTTSATGEGTVNFEFKVPTIPSGTRFDVMFRLLNDMTSPTSIFQSACFTVTVL